MRIVVSDNGRGIDAEYLPYVFDRFSQGDSNTARKLGGLGLGLSIVKHIVESHGGTVEASSEGEGRGATFTVRLPIQAVRPSTPPAHEEVRAQGKPPIRLDGLRILVVDDDADARRLISKVLAKAGADIAVAESARAALTLLEKQKFQVPGQRSGIAG